MASDYPYAGFWRRFGGYLIDYLVVVVAAVLIEIISLRLHPPTAHGSLGMWVLFVSLVVPWLYHAGMESSTLQATVGKLVVGVKVTDLEGRRVSFLRATGRYFAQILSALTLCIGYAMVAFTRKRQALHDMVAGTLVVLRDRSQEQIASAGPAPEVSGWLIAAAIIGVLFLGPFGVGVLAAISIPAYQDYTIRAQVAEGLNEAGPYKAAVSEAFAKGQTLSTLTTEQLGLASAGESHFVRSIEVSNGIVVITYGNRANAQISGRRVLLIPGTSADRRELVWVCGKHPAPEGVSLSRAVDLSSYTTVLDRNLPPLCRRQ